jgi:hypothetical protein
MLSCPNKDYKGNHALINLRKKISGTTNTHSHDVMKIWTVAVDGAILN